MIASCALSSNEWLDKIRVFFDKQKVDPLAMPFVFSTTENRDQESQWQEYGDTGCGVAFGFRANYLPSLMKIYAGPIGVVYEDDAQSRIVARVMDDYIKLIKGLGLTKTNRPAYIGELGLAYFRASYLQSIRFKDDSFVKEQEWRYTTLAAKTHAQIKEIEKDSENKKIVEIALDDLNKNLITVVVGPGPRKKERAKELEAFKAVHKLDFEVLQSALSLE